MSCLKCSKQIQYDLHLNKHKENAENESFKNKEYNNPWIVNFSDVQIPEKVNDVLRLEKEFSSSFLTKKKDMVFQIVKNIESNMVKIKKEKDRKELRHKLTNTTSNFSLKSQNISAIDKIIAQSLKETKLFSQKNSDIFITHADKGNVTVILNRSDYNKRILQLINDNSTYKITNYNPIKLMKNDTCKLLENWRVKDFLVKNISKKVISLNNTGLPRIYGFPKIHKENFPLRPVVSLINTPT